MTRDKWLHLGRIPAGFYDVGRSLPAHDKLVAQVDTLVMTDACVHRAERLAFLTLLSEAFPTFVRVNPPPASKWQDAAPLSDEARQFFTSGQPELADRYFPWLVNVMSPAYWIYLAMAATVLFNAMGAYSRFRLWRTDANRALLEARIRTLAGPGLCREQIKALPPETVLKTPADRHAAEALVRELDVLRARCDQQFNSFVTPMGAEMLYRYQELLIEEARTALTAWLKAGARQ